MKELEKNLKESYKTFFEKEVLPSININKFRKDSNDILFLYHSVQSREFSIYFEQRLFSNVVIVKLPNSSLIEIKYKKSSTIGKKITEYYDYYSNKEENDRLLQNLKYLPDEYIRYTKMKNL